ncbi:MAG: cupredoxin domain-containing protein [Patescibacteria group bacterium]|jgi:Cu+-exporting ATPase
MQILGIILIIVIAGLFFLWLRFQRQQEAAVQTSSGVQQQTIVVRAAYKPNVVSIRTGTPIELIFDRQEDTECSRFVTFEDLHIRQDLPAFQKTIVNLPALPKGEVLFTCDMGMYQGKLVIS